MKMSQEQVRTIVAKLITLSIYGDNTKTASQNAEMRSQLISLLKKTASSMTTREINEHLQRTVNSIENNFFNTMFLVATGVDFATIKKSKFDLIQNTTDLRTFIRHLDAIGAIDRLFCNTGVAEKQRIPEVLKLLKVLKKNFTLKYLVRSAQSGIDNVGGMPVNEFVTDAVMDVVLGETFHTEGDDYLVSLGLQKMRKIKSGRSLLALLINEYGNQYHKRASLASDEVGTKAGDWAWLKSELLRDFKWTGNKIKTFTIARMRQLKDTSVPLNLTDEGHKVLMESIDSFDLGDGTIEGILEDYRDRGLDSTSLRNEAKRLNGLAKKGNLIPDEVPNIFSVLFTTDISQATLRYGLENVEHVSTDRSVQNKMRELAYKQLYKKGYLTSQEQGFLDSSNTTPQARFFMRDEVVNRFGMPDLKVLVNRVNLADRFEDQMGEGDQTFNTLVDEEGYPLFGDNLDEVVLDPAYKLLRRYEVLPPAISSKVDIGVHEAIRTIQGFLIQLTRKARSLKSYGEGDKTLDSS